MYPEGMKTLGTAVVAIGLAVTAVFALPNPAEAKPVKHAHVQVHLRDTQWG